MRFLSCMTLALCAPLCVFSAPPRLPVPDQAQVTSAAASLKPGLEMTAMDGPDRPRRLIARAAAQVYEPAIRYAMLTSARDAAITAGDAVTAIDAIKAIAISFDVDELKLAHRTLDETAIHASMPEQFGALARLGMEVTEKRLAGASSAADYTDADRLAAATSTWALASRDGALQVKAQGWGHDIHALCDEASRITPAFAQLADKPNDPQANLAVGRLLCFHQNDWTRGLPRLAKGSDVALASLASLELTQSADPQVWSQLGDGWWSQSSTAQGIAQSHLQQHACRWYAKTLPHAIGPRRALIERRATEAGFSPSDLDKLRDSADTPH